MVSSEEGAPVRARSVAAIEALGVNSLWTGGHIATGKDMAEAITGLSRLTAVTEQAFVGTA